MRGVYPRELTITETAPLFTTLLEGRKEGRKEEKKVALGSALFRSSLSRISDAPPDLKPICKGPTIHPQRYHMHANPDLILRWLF